MLEIRASNERLEVLRMLVPKRKDKSFTRYKKINETQSFVLQL